MDWEKFVLQFQKKSKGILAKAMAIVVVLTTVAPISVGVIPMFAYAAEEEVEEASETSGEADSHEEETKSEGDSGSKADTAAPADSADDSKSESKLEEESNTDVHGDEALGNEEHSASDSATKGTSEAGAVTSEESVPKDDMQSSSQGYERASGYSTSGGSGYWKNFSKKELEPEEALFQLKTSSQNAVVSPYEELDVQWSACWVLLTQEDRSAGVRSGQRMRAADLMELFVMGAVFENAFRSKSNLTMSAKEEQSFTDNHYLDLDQVMQCEQDQWLYRIDRSGSGKGYAERKFVSDESANGENASESSSEEITEPEDSSVELDQDVFDLVHKMIVEADAEATDELITNVLGEGNAMKGVAAVNKFLDDHNFAGTSMGRLMGDVYNERDNYTTAYDCARFMRAIYEGKLVSEEASEQMRDLLKEQPNQKLISAGINGYNASSAVIANRSCKINTEDDGVIVDDCAIVQADKNDYVLVVLSSSEYKSEQKLDAKNVTNSQSEHGDATTEDSALISEQIENLAKFIQNLSEETYSLIGTSSLYLPVNDKDHWDSGTDKDLPYNVSTTRDEGFVKAMLEYACYWDGCIPYASSQNNTDPDNMRSKRLRKGGRTDCSWFVYHVLHKFGLLNDFTHSYEWGNNPSTYPGAHNIGSDVSKASPGDILCMGVGEKPQNSHVAIYIGNGMQVECGAEDGVKVHAAPSSVREIVHFDCLPR